MSFNRFICSWPSARSCVGGASPSYFRSGAGAGQIAAEHPRENGTRATRVNMKHTENMNHTNTITLHMALGRKSVEPKFTYEEGASRAGHSLGGMCNSGKMQAPIDVNMLENLRIYIFQVQLSTLLIWTSSSDWQQYPIVIDLVSPRTITGGSKSGRSHTF